MQMKQVIEARRKSQNQAKNDKRFHSDVQAMDSNKKKYGTNSFVRQASPRNYGPTAINQTILDQTVDSMAPSAVDQTMDQDKNEGSPISPDSLDKISKAQRILSKKSTRKSKVERQMLQQLTELQEE